PRVRAGSAGELPDDAAVDPAGLHLGDDLVDVDGGDPQSPQAEASQALPRPGRWARQGAGRAGQVLAVRSAASTRGVSSAMTAAVSASSRTLSSSRCLRAS